MTYLSILGYEPDLLFTQKEFPIDDLLLNGKTKIQKINDLRDLQNHILRQVNSDEAHFLLERIMIMNVTGPESTFSFF